MSADYSREWISSRLKNMHFDHDEMDGDFRLVPDLKDMIIENAKTRAAVLIGLVEREDGIHIILTRRTKALSSHSGQVAFPGGKIDEADASPEDAALREAHEEIGLERNNCEILTRLPDYYTGSKFIIAPVIAFVRSDSSFDINPHEVDEMFEVPLSFLMCPDNHKISTLEISGKPRQYYEMPYNGHHIWGVTAGIIKTMYHRIFNEAA